MLAFLKSRSCIKNSKRIAMGRFALNINFRTWIFRLLTLLGVAFELKILMETPGRASFKI